jgi:tetrahydromethanopterin S-methyltransferase subunit B
MKLLLTLAVLLITSLYSAAYAQLPTNGAFAQNHWVINAGYGTGGIYYNGFTNNVRHFGPSLSVDYMITHKLGIGQISAGLVLSYANEDLTYGVNESVVHDKYTSMLVGLRAAYHFILPVKGLDPYVGVMLASIAPTYPTLIGGPTPDQTTVTSGIYAGVHYFFLHWLGVFAELGKNGFSIGTAGLSFKL